jgi:hypothetical protein
MPQQVSFVLALQRSAGNAAVTRALQRQEAETQTSPKEALKDEVLYYLNGANANYVSAVAAARSALIQKAIDEKDKKDLWKELAISVGSMFLPGGLAAAFLTDKANEAIASMLSKKVIEQAVADDLYKLVKDQLTEKGLQDGVAYGQKLLGTEQLKVKGNDATARTDSYLDTLDDLRARRFVKAFEKVKGASLADLMTLVAITKTLAEDAKIYREEVKTRADHFRTQIADIVPRDSLTSHASTQFALINAYGRPRWARVRPGAVSGWVFEQWLTPDMEDVAAALYADKEPPKLKPSDLPGHLPAPGKERGETAMSKVVRMDAWGRIRYAFVKIPEGPVESERYHFERWVLKSEETAILVHEDLQTGGIPTVSSDIVLGKSTPSD